MPFTPLHMGPGMAIKAALPKHFSIVVFGLVQIALDLEVLWYLARWNPPLHRFWHTYLGATLIGALFAVIGKPLSQIIKLLWNQIADQRSNASLRVSTHTTWTASILGAFTGAWSHILLDSLFHGDMEPLQPWSDRNPLIGLMGPMMLQWGCILMGVVGLIWFFMRDSCAGRQ